MKRELIKEIKRQIKEFVLQKEILEEYQENYLDTLLSLFYEQAKHEGMVEIGDIFTKKEGKNEKTI